MTAARLLLVLTALTLANGCSRSTRVGARFIDGRLTFIAPGGEDVRCIHWMKVSEKRTGRTVWAIDAPPPERCIARLPLRYGAMPDRGVVSTAPARLRPGIVYEIYGVGGGSDYLCGAFEYRIGRAYQLRDL